MKRSGPKAASQVGRFLFARDYASFLKTFDDCYFGWERFVFWRSRSGYSGITLWGHVSGDDGVELRRAIEQLLDSKPQEHWPDRTSLLDASEVVTVDPRAFEVVAQHFAAQGARRERPVRQAMIRPRGYTGSIVAGFFAVAPPPFETRVFTSVAEAMTWLGARDDALTADLELLRDTLSHEVPGISALRRLLDTDTANCTLESAARRLGVSTRTLQRRLSLAETTFQQERCQAQVRAGQVLLSQTGDKIAAIARAVGCSSAPQFSALFRRLVGLTPSQFREQARRSLVEGQR